jgi:UDP-N-acetylglucosamine 3-dehydrogenase
MKIGVISFAHMHALSYVKALVNLEGVQLAGIADENEERGMKFAEMFGTTYYQDHRKMLENGLDAVIVCSENANHKRHVVDAANAGVHVLCEKPLSTNVEDANEMIQVCREQGVILQTAFPVRFNSPVARAKQMVDEGKIGEIIAIKGTNRGTNPGGWFVEKDKSGGGAVIDHTVHVLDIMRWLSGAEATQVYAEIGFQTFSDYPIDDCGLLTIQFDNGMFGTLDCSWSRNEAFPTWGDVTLEIIGTKGNLFVDAFAQKIDVYSNDSGVKWHYWGDNMDARLIADFVQTVNERRAPSITGEDGMRAVEVAVAAYRSAERKQPVML